MKGGKVGHHVIARHAQLRDYRAMTDQIDHAVKLTHDVVIPPMQCKKTVGIAKIPCLAKRMNVITEPL